MTNDLAGLLGMLLKYGIYLFFIVIALSLISSFVSKLRNEPGPLFKVLFVALTPFATAVAIPYFVLHELFEAPFWVSFIAGLAVYAVTTDFLDKRIHAKFKDEIDC